MLNDLNNISNDIQNKFNNIEHIIKQTSKLKSNHEKFSEYSRQAKSTENSMASIKDLIAKNKIKKSNNRIRKIIRNKNIVEQKWNKVIDLINK